MCTLPCNFHRKALPVECDTLAAIHKPKITRRDVKCQLEGCKAPWHWSGQPRNCVLCSDEASKTFGMSWSAICEPDLIVQYQCLTSLMLLWQNGSRKPSQKSRGCYCCKKGTNSLIIPFILEEMMDKQVSRYCQFIRYSAVQKSETILDLCNFESKQIGRASWRERGS